MIAFIVGLLLWRGVDRPERVTTLVLLESPQAQAIATQPSLATCTALPAPASAIPLPTTPSQPPTWTASAPSATTPPDLPGKIVFTCTIEKYNQLCLMNADGSGWQRLTERRANDYYPSFSPDGMSIVYVSNQTGLFEIYQRILVLGEEKQLTDGVGNVSAPDISPDGQSVIFASKFTGGDSSVWKMQIDGSQVRPLTDSQWNEIDPVWSPDGGQIAFAAARGGYVELFVMEADGNEIRQVSSGVQGIGGRSCWSPDGRWLAFYAGPRGDRDVYLVEAASGKLLRLTYGGNNTAPCFSPDGEWLVFSSSRDGDHEIYVMRLDGSQPTQLTDNNYDDWQPNWGP